MRFNPRISVLKRTISRLQQENMALQQELADLNEAHEALLSEGDSK